ncbi:MAG TPA: TlpA disulfide reductase family protein [Gemmatimonadales bacterium]|nr:TlpA disulfide reductase family protein [Gemmatimonadales bacterium]
MSPLRAVVPCFMVLLGAQQLSGQDAALDVGDRAPRVVVHDLDGKPVDLGRYIGAKPVFLEFWATWCESCQELLPRVRAAQKAYGSRVEFIGVNVAVNQSPASVRRYLEAVDPGFRTLYDDEGTSTRAYQVPATSYVVIVGRSGKIVYTGIGGTQSFDRVLRQVSE